METSVQSYTLLLFPETINGTTSSGPTQLSVVLSTVKPHPSFPNSPHCAFRRLGATLGLQTCILKYEAGAYLLYGWVQVNLSPQFLAKPGRMMSYHYITSKFETCINSNIYMYMHAIHTCRPHIHARTHARMHPPTYPPTHTHTPLIKFNELLVVAIERPKEGKILFSLVQFRVRSQRNGEETLHWVQEQALRL